MGTYFVVNKLSMSGLSGHTRRYNPRRSAEECARMLTSRIVNAQSDGALADFVEQHVGKFDEIHVSTAANKLAKLTARRHTITLSKSQRDSVLLLLEERLHDFESISARPVANLLWSCAKLGYDDGNHSMVHYLSDQVPRVVDDFKPQELANTVWAWATMRHQPSDKVLIALERRVLACVDDFDPQNLANTVWAWATMRHQPSADALAALERRMLACVDDFNPQELTNTSWAVAMLMNNIESDKITIDQNVLDRLLRRLEHAAQLRSLDVIGYQQIFQAHHMLGDRFKPSVALLDQAREAWAKSTLACASSSSRSSLEREVIACLDRLGITYDVEALTEDGMHCVDMLVRGRTDDGGERLLAIECDGPTHFMRDSDGKYRIDGSTYARNCDLRKLGLGVLSVARHEWIRLKKDERDAYLSRELQERGIVF